VTAKEWRYIGQYAEAHSLKPQLSNVSLGQITFTDSEGKEVTASLTTMKAEYEQSKADKKGKK
jgi:hypothetical protein